MVGSNAAAIAGGAMAAGGEKKDAIAAAERQADVARLLAGFRQHLHDRTANHGDRAACS
jgi:histidine decarboxylase